MGQENFVTRNGALQSRAQCIGTSSSRSAEDLMHLRAMLMSMSRGAVVVAVRSGSFKQPSKLCGCLTSRCKISPEVVKRPGATFATHRKGYCESTFKQLGRPPHPQSSHDT